MKSLLLPTVPGPLTSPVFRLNAKVIFMKPLIPLLLMSSAACASSDVLTDEYIALSVTKDQNPSSFEIAFDLNKALAIQCQQAVPIRELLTQSEAFNLLKAYSVGASRDEHYFRALNNIQCDDPYSGLLNELRPSQGKE